MPHTSEDLQVLSIAEGDYRKKSQLLLELMIS